jgi:hypothetical protein
MVERFGKGKPLHEAILGPFPVAGELQRVGAHCVRANARIVAAESVAEVTVAGHVIGLHTDPAIVQSRRDIASEKSRRPALPNPSAQCPTQY